MGLEDQTGLQRKLQTNKEGKASDNTRRKAKEVPCLFPQSVLDAGPLSTLLFYILLLFVYFFQTGLNKPRLALNSQFSSFH